MDDLISRQAAIDAARKCRVIEVTPAYILIDKSEIMTELMCLPSAQPQRTGHWISMTCRYEPGAEGFPYLIQKWTEATKSDDINGLKCSECGEIYDFTEARNWCSECGARMEEEK